MCERCDVSIKGGELFEFIETEGRVDEDVSVRLLRQVLEGVQFLHSHNILHMDIKVCRVLYYWCCFAAVSTICYQFHTYFERICMITCSRLEYGDGVGYTITPFMRTLVSCP